MSKRRQNYEKGFQRLNDLFELICKEDELPDKEHIEAEIKAINQLKQLPVEIYSPQYPFKQKDPFFVLLRERYLRYDDVIPQEITVHILPTDMDDEKSLHKLLRDNE